MFNVIDVMSVSNQRVDESTFDHLHIALDIEMLSLFTTIKAQNLKKWTEL